MYDEGKTVVLNDEPFLATFWQDVEREAAIALASDLSERDRQYWTERLQDARDHRHLLGEPLSADEETSPQDFWRDVAQTAYARLRTSLGDRDRTYWTARLAEAHNHLMPRSHGSASETLH